MLVIVQTEQDTYEYKPEAQGYYCELEVQAIDQDTPHTFKAVLSIANPVDHIHVTRGDVLDISGQINYRHRVFLAVDASKMTQPAI